MFLSFCLEASSFVCVLCEKKAICGQVLFSGSLLQDPVDCGSHSARRRVAKSDAVEKLCILRRLPFQHGRKPTQIRCTTNRFVPCSASPPHGFVALMSKVIFYKITQRENKEPTICLLAQEQVTQGKRVLICCEDEGQRARLDQKLWSQDPASFLPHTEWPSTQKYLVPIFLYCSPFSSVDLREAAEICDTLITVPSCRIADIEAFAHVIDFAELYDPKRREDSLQRHRLWRDAGHPPIVKEASAIDLTH